MLLFLISVSIIAHAASPPPLNDPVEGQKLARELREMTPAGSTSLTGTLRIYAPDKEPILILLRSLVSVGEKAWSSEYFAGPTNHPAREVLTIGRFNGAATNSYSWQHDNKSETPVGDRATNAFAGSDFALLDLGLEFFNWPTQTLAFKEMRKGRGCRVLESRPARATLYSRVLSWIDEETSGVLMAEAHDARGKLLKEFEVKSFKKVEGRYQLSEMEIRNVQAKTRTRLVFDFDKH